MSDNPYEPPTDEAAFELRSEMRCPACDAPMQAGFISSAAHMYWRGLTDRKWLLWPSDRVPGTRPAFVGHNKMPAFRCLSCQLIVFRFGTAKVALL